MEHLMKKYKQLTLGLRYQIFAYKQENLYVIVKMDTIVLNTQKYKLHIEI